MYEDSAIKGTGEKTWDRIGPFAKETLSAENNGTVRRGGRFYILQ